MSKNPKMFSALIKALLILAAFILINCGCFLRMAVQGGADYLLIGMVATKLLKDYNNKQGNKTYKKVIMVLIPLIFFGSIISLFFITSLGNPTANFVCLLVGIAIGAIIFLRKKAKQPI